MPQSYGHKTNYVGLAVVALRRQDQDPGAYGAQPARGELPPGIGASARDPAQRGAAGHQGAGIGWHRDRPHGGSDASLPLESSLFRQGRVADLPSPIGGPRVDGHKADRRTAQDATANRQAVA